MRFVVFAMLLVCACALSAEPPSGVATNVSVPKNSIYQLTDTFTDQNGKDFKLAERSGQVSPEGDTEKKVQLVAMFYSSCKYACPLIIDSAKAVEHALSPKLRGKLAVLLISFDPARDTPPVLAALALERKLDLSRWTLARTESGSVRKVAALLGVRYRELANGEFNHSSQLIILDAQGRFLARTEKMGGVPEPEFMQVLEQALSGE